MRREDVSEIAPVETAPDDWVDNGDTAPDAAPTKTVNWAAFLEFLLQHRGLLVRCLGVGFVCFALLAFLIPSRYTSTTRLMPPDQPNSSAMMAALAARTGEGLSSYAGELLGIRTSGALFVGVLHSRSLQDALINRFDLRKVYGVRYWETARKKLESNTDISEERQSGIITISIQDHDRQRAQALANAYIEELNRSVMLLSTSSARREREFLETRLQAVKLELDQAAREFSQFASKNTAIDIPQQAKAMVEAAATLQGELIAAESELRGIEEIYTGNNVRVQSVRARVAELKRQLDILGGATGAGSQGADPMYPSIRKLPLLGVTYADLYRRTKIQEAVYETLTKQYEMAKVQEAKEIPSVRVLDPPDLPERRSFPPRALIIVVGTLAALAAGVGWVAVLKFWADTDPRDPRKLLVRRTATALHLGKALAAAEMRAATTNSAKTASAS